MRRSRWERQIVKTGPFEYLKGAYRGLIYALLVFNLTFFGSPLQISKAFAQSNAAMTGNPDAPQTIDEQKAACAADSARRWDPEINSCVVKNEVMETKEGARECENSDDPQACYLSKAEEQTNVGSGDKFEDNKMEAIASRVSAVYSLFALITGMSNFDGVTDTTKKELKGHGKEGKGSCTSKTIFMVTSVAWTIGDMFLKKSAKKNFKKIAEKYKIEATNENQKGGDAGSYQAQVRAFSYLKEEQQQIKEQATKRRNLQLAMVAGFVASLGFAIYEVTPAGVAAGAACMKYDENQAKDIKDAGKVDAKYATKKEALAGVDGFMTQIGNMGTSAQVLVGAGIMLGLNAYLIFHANNEKERAENNISAIDYALKTFSEYASGFCPDGRDDLNNERCYCYNDDGSQNSNRSKSVICQNLFKADNMNYALTNPKLKPVTNGPRQGCLTVTGQFDEDCKCRKMINNVSKQNACSKAPNGLALSSALGTQLGAQQAVSTLGNFGQGANRALATLNGAALSKSAAKKKKLVDSMLKQAKAKGVDVPGMGELEKMAENLVLAEDKVLAGGLRPNAPRMMASGLRPKEMDKALALAEKTAGVESKPIMNIGKGVSAIGPSGKKKGFKFDWNDTAAREGNKVQTFMDKNYKYKDSDIVKREDVSLWNVISRRYQTSGLKRLFGEDDE